MHTSCTNILYVYHVHTVHTSCTCCIVCVKLEGCCRNETILDCKTIGTLFTASIETMGQRSCERLEDEDRDACDSDCQQLRQEPVRLAFKGSHRKLITKCPDFKIVINITATTVDCGMFNICWIGFKTERIQTAIITIDDSPPITVSLAPS